ncbi:MAG: hypothetical protein JNL32_10725 [Candidatus Kapabacteria bacterium]|nr:hypothetical protein [Candidatus Kapabacteria bacterium]
MHLSNYYNYDILCNPRYILDVLLGVIGISVKSVELVKALPKVGFEEEEV